MPIENRSGNTEQMVSVPRDKFEEALRIVGSYGFKEFAEEVRALLAQPAAQHQGEPLAEIVSFGEGLKEVAWRKGQMPEVGAKLYLHPPTSAGFSAGDMADQGAKAFRDGQRAITELNEDLRAILGRPGFTCIGIAQALRKMGHTIARKAEEEQATVIHWLLGHYLKHGSDWRQHASDELKAASQSPE